MYKSLVFYPRRRGLIWERCLFAPTHRTCNYKHNYKNLRMLVFEKSTYFTSFTTASSWLVAYENMGQCLWKERPIAHYLSTSNNGQQCMVQIRPPCILVTCSSHLMTPIVHLQMYSTHTRGQGVVLLKWIQGKKKKMESLQLGDFSLEYSIVGLEARILNWCSEIKLGWIYHNTNKIK